MSFLIFKNGRLYLRKRVRIVRRVSRMKKHTVSEEKRLRAEAAVIARERVEHFNKYYGFSYGRIAIRNQKTRWGSCSSKGNLNFNYRIAELAPELQDYLVVHELCHLKEMNHGPNFWKLVGEQVPEYKRLSATLRKYPL